MAGFSVGRHSISWVCSLFSSGALFLFIVLNKPLYKCNYNTLHRSAGAIGTLAKSRVLALLTLKVNGIPYLVIARFLVLIHCKRCQIGIALHSWLLYTAMRVM